MNTPQMQKLLEAHSSAKKKMILGIIFTAVAFFFSLIGLSLLSSYYTEEEGIVFVLLAQPGLGIGLPFLIIGMINLIKLNRQISNLRALETRGFYQQPVQQPVYQQPVQQPVYQQPVQQPVYQQPVQQPVYQQPVQQPVYQQPVQQPVYQQPVQQPAYQEPVQQSAAPQEDVNPTTSLDFVDIDWQKYSPLEAGISYNPNKDYKFHRADGFVGSVPQNFVNRTFPKCPICCAKEPYWTIAQHNQMSWKGNLYLFKCSCCGGIISMSMPDVTTLGNGASGIVSNPTVGLTNLMAKASSGKEVGAVYAVIESVGTSGASPIVAGKEFKLEDLQDMYLRM